MDFIFAVYEPYLRWWWSKTRYFQLEMFCNTKFSFEKHELSKRSSDFIAFNIVSLLPLSSLGLIRLVNKHIVVLVRTAFLEHLWCRYLNNKEKPSFIRSTNIIDLRTNKWKPVQPTMFVERMHSKQWRANCSKVTEIAFVRFFAGMRSDMQLSQSKEKILKKNRIICGALENYSRGLDSGSLHSAGPFVWIVCRNGCIWMVLRRCAYAYEGPGRYERYSFCHINGIYTA